MSDKNFIRRNKRADNVHADPRAIQARQHETVRQPAAHQWSWITERSAVEDACLDILRGKPGLYPIFGIQLHVELRDGDGEQYPVLVYSDAKYGADGQDLCGLIHPGFSMAPAVLTWTIGPKTKFKTPDHELLTRTLLSQREMQLARATFAEEVRAVEREAARAQREAIKQAAVARNDRLAKLREAGAGTTVKKLPPPVLGSLSEILSAGWGTIEVDGLTILVCRAEKGERTVVRLKNVPEDHPMAEAAAANLYAWQDALGYADDSPTEVERTGKALLSYRMRMYLRGLLIGAGVVLAPPVSKDSTVAENGNGAHHQEGADLGNAQSVEGSAIS